MARLSAISFFFLLFFSSVYICIGNIAVVVQSERGHVFEHVQLCVIPQVCSAFIAFKTLQINHLWHFKDLGYMHIDLCL